MSAPTGGTRGRRALVALAATIALAACGGGGDDGDDDVAAPGVEQPADDGEPGDDIGGGGGDASGDDGPVAAPMCTEDAPDCDDTPDAPDAGSCLVGDEDCTDESYDGQDVATPLPLAGAPLEGEQATEGVTQGATAAPLTGAHLLGDTTLQLGFGGNPCTLVEDVLVDESSDEVRVMVLTGQDPAVDACTEVLVPYVTTVTLDDPLGDRTLLDLAG